MQFETLERRDHLTDLTGVARVRHDGTIVVEHDPDFAVAITVETDLDNVQPTYLHQPFRQLEMHGRDRLELRSPDRLVQIDGYEMPFRYYGTPDDELAIAYRTNDSETMLAVDVVFECGDGNTPGDANADGAVDFQDFLAMANNFGREREVATNGAGLEEVTGVTFAEGDFDCDGRVDFQDFVALAQNFGL